MKLLVFLCLASTQLLIAQYEHESVFPNLENDELLTALQDNFKPAVVLEKPDAKDTLYRRIYLYKDSVSCVYSGLSKFLDLNEDPSVHLFGTGTNTDINLEHGWPKSKGSESGLAENDMHHLFPSRVPVNSARGSDPFAEIQDNRTKNWYYKDQNLSNIPTSNIDLYAEDEDQSFEPPEDFKGNIARAMFYFYTIYRSEAEYADPDFFDLQRKDLCAWHEQDPVDSLEWHRNIKISTYQEDKKNPFILDCRLARLYCDDIDVDCNIVSTERKTLEQISLKSNSLKLGESLSLMDYQPAGQKSFAVYSIEGRLIYSASLPRNGVIAGPMNPGIYILNVTENKSLLLVKRFIVK